jgi:hypothetical protein
MHGPRCEKETGRTETGSKAKQVQRSTQFILCSQKNQKARRDGKDKGFVCWQGGVKYLIGMAAGRLPRWLQVTTDIQKVKGVVQNT